MSSAGLVIIFVFALAGTAIIGAVVLPYIAHCLMTVFQDSAAGNDDLQWPAETVLDWAKTALYVIGVLAPPFLLVRGIQFVVGSLGNPWLDLALALFLATWLLFPLCLMSSLFGQHPWMLLHPALLARVFRNPVALTVFYLVSGTLLVAAGLLVRLALTSNAVTFFVAALVGAIIPLLYGRLLGRLAWVAGYHTKTAKRRKKRTRPFHGATAHDPWAVDDDDPPEVNVEVLEDELPYQVVEEKKSESIFDTSRRASLSNHDAPVDEEDEWAPKKKPYQLLSDSQAEASWKHTPFEPQLASKSEVYDVDIPDHSSPPPTSNDTDQSTRDHTDSGHDHLMHQAEQWIRPKKRSKPSVFESMVDGVLTFPFRSGVPRAWFNLSISGLALGLMLRLLVTFWPL